MPTAGDMLPPTAGWMAREIRALKAALSELRAARRLENASVGAGGLAIEQGGALTMRTPDGIQAVYVGALGPELVHMDGSTQQAIWLRREDGTLAVAVYADPATTGSDRQGVAILDYNGRIVMADDVIHGGLARPWVSASGWYDVTGVETPVSVTTSSTFAAVVEQEIYQQHPHIRVVVRVRTSNGTTAGEVRLTCDSDQIGSTVTIAAGTYGQYEIEGDSLIPPGGWGRLLVEARRTAGSGTIGVRGLTTWGTQS